MDHLLAQAQRTRGGQGERSAIKRNYASSVARVCRQRLRAASRAGRSLVFPRLNLFERSQHVAAMATQVGHHGTRSVACSSSHSISRAPAAALARSGQQFVWLLSSLARSDERSGARPMQASCAYETAACCCPPTGPRSGVPAPERVSSGSCLIRSPEKGRITCRENTAHLDGSSNMTSESMLRFCDVPGTAMHVVIEDDGKSCIRVFEKRSGRDRI
jgi:hypothetical protein